MTITTQRSHFGLEPAIIDTRDATPRAPRYADVYFSADDGPAESRHVFIDGNDLRRRLAAWTAMRPFVIGETGFGTGRNALIAWQTFLATAASTARLHIVSVERHPLRAEELIALWDQNAELATYAHRLAAQWPEPMRGSHRLQLDERVTLDLVLDDVDTALADLDARVDAWFLDGFAPAHNVAMWSQSVFHGVAAASQPGATFATYSCARRVRDHATAAGFIWHKRPGAGRKRDMLCGELPQMEHTEITPARTQRPWFEPPAHIDSGAIAIIGAGLAGTSVAEALARRGYSCDMYDPHGGPGGASANAQAALHVRPAADADVRTQFYLAALTYTQRWLANLDPDRQLWSDCGLLQLACSDAEWQRQQRRLQQLGLPTTLVQPVDACAAAEHAGIALADSLRGGLWYPQAGWVRPAALCRHLLARSGARLHHTAVNALQRRGNRWQLACDNGDSASYTHVVLANAHDATRLCTDIPPLTPIRGQISQFTATDHVTAPACVVCGRGGVMPAHDGHIQVGASFVTGDDDTTPRIPEDQANIDMLADIAPALAHALGAPGSARVACRCASHDRLPCVGPVPDTTAWRRDYAALALDAHRIAPTPGTHQPGLWATLAHGGNGMVGAPLAAEMLVSRLLDDPMPLPAPIVDALHPGRWLIRELKRGR